MGDNRSEKSGVFEDDFRGNFEVENGDFLGADSGSFSGEILGDSGGDFRGQESGKFGGPELRNFDGYLSWNFSPTHSEVLWRGVPARQGTIVGKSFGRCPDAVEDGEIRTCEEASKEVR